MQDASGQPSGSRRGQGQQLRLQAARPFSPPGLTFSPVSGICSCVCALKSNITEDSRVDFGIEHSGIKSQPFRSQAM